MIVAGFAGGLIGAGLGALTGLGMGLLEGKGTEGDTFGEGIGSVTGIVSGGSIVFFFGTGAGGAVTG